MRVLIGASPAVGHLTPLLPIAAALRRRGHEVVVATSPSLPDVPIPDGVVRVAKDPLEFPSDPPHGAGRALWWREQNAEMARQSFRHCSRLVRELAPQLIIRDFAERGAYLAAELHGLPHVEVFTDATTGYLDGIAEEAALVTPLRRALGLADDVDGSRLVPLLGISTMHPTFFDPTRPRLPQTRDFNRLAGTRRRGSASHVLVTLGTTVTVPHRDFTLMALEALEPLGRPVIGLVPDDLAPRLASSSTSATIVGFSELEGLVRDAALVVLHGGFGTLTEAIGAGVPVHVTPFHSDQLHNADRVVALGLGRQLAWGDCSVDRMAASFGSVLTEDRFREAARRMQAKMDAMADLDDCAALVECVIHG